MERQKLWDAMIGMMAYDTGSVDSGIKNELYREQVKKYLKGLSQDEFRVEISCFVARHFLTDEALNLGYGIEDVKAFINWMDEYMGIYI